MARKNGAQISHRMVAKVHLQVPYHKYVVINAPTLCDCTVYTTIESQQMRCLNKHRCHFSVLLGLLTVCNDAAFFNCKYHCK